MAMQPETMLYLFQEMSRIRLVEERIADLYPEQEMRCPVHLSIGQEGIAVGTCANLEPEDYVLSNHRSHAHYLAKGGNLKAMLAELYGKVTGCCHGLGGSMHLIDLAAGFLGAAPIVASTIPIAAGVAFGVLRRGEARVTVTFFGEGSTEEGAFFEAVNFAVLKNLPLVLVCENNLYSVYSPMSVRQPTSRDIPALARAHGMETIEGDGNAVEQVHQLTHQAIAKARAGGGPTLLAFSTYRWREHCGPNYDNNIGYRTAAEFLEWKARCPVERLRRRILESGAMTESDIRAMTQTLHSEIDAAVAHAKESPFPPTELLQQNIYAP